MFNLPLHGYHDISQHFFSYKIVNVLAYSKY